MPIGRVFSVLKPDFPLPFPKCYIVSSGEGNILPSMLAHSVLPSFAFHNMCILPSLLSIFLLLYCMIPLSSVSFLSPFFLFLLNIGGAERTVFLIVEHYIYMYIQPCVTDLDPFGSVTFGFAGSGYG
jgi:hypothetical protein